MENGKRFIPWRARVFLRRFLFRNIVARLYGPVTNEMYVYREFVAGQYIKGKMRGLEIGALDRPLRLRKSCGKKKVDRMTKAALMKQYPAANPKEIVETDIVDDGERLETVGDSTQDFVVANHFLEHCGNPAAAISNMLRVLKKNGVLFLSVPDKRLIFDADRQSTPFEHIIKDHEEGPEGTRHGHYEEWVRLVEKVDGEAELEKRVVELMGSGYSIHFHVWTGSEFLETVLKLREKLDLKFDLEHCSKSGYETVMVLRKRE